MKSVLKWQVGYCNTENTRPEEFFEATVPGAVQLDYAKAYNLPDYREGLNFKQYQWMQDKFWLYKTTYDATGIEDKANLFLVAKGIDYKSDIFVNGEKLNSYEGMYKPQKIDLTAYKGKILSIEVLVYPKPVSTLQKVHPNTRDEANQCTKPAVSYGWDFHPRLIPLGIWDEFYMEITEHQPITAKVTYTLNKERTNAVVNMSADLSSNNAVWTLTDPQGNLVFEGRGAEQCFAVQNPKLWWCNGYGEPNLYKWELEVLNLGVKEYYRGTVGFKTVSLEMNEGAWSDAPLFPKSRNSPPATVTLNGVPVFAKGTNWVSPEIFYATANKNRYEEQLSLIKKANLNIIRCWGGANVNKDYFYDICDELGIMVWQEFPLGCNNYIATEHYMSVLNLEAKEIIERVSKHACHVLWCGGNELFNSWSGMTDQSLALRLLNKLTFELTPNIPFIPTSPLMNMAHGCYRFYYQDAEVIQNLANAKNTAYPEMGIPAIASLETLKQIANEDELFPLEMNELTKAHHAFGAWGDGAWSALETYRKYFGNPNSLEELINNSQFMQRVGYQFIYEEARRQKPYCSMVINWCFNEPWPCIANNSVIGYPNVVKDGYYGIKTASRSVMASARIRKFSYKAYETFDFDLFLLNDSTEKVDGGEINAFIQIGDGEKKHLITWQYKDVKINTNVEGPTVRTKLPNVCGAERVKLILESGAYSTEYELIYKPTVSKADVIKMLNM